MLTVGSFAISNARPAGVARPGLKLCLAVVLLLCTLPLWADPWKTENFGEMSIVLPENASPELLRAADVLDANWRIICSNRLSSGTTATKPTGIWLGREVAPSSIVPPEEIAALGADGFIIRTYKENPRDADFRVGSHLVIAGYTDAATLDGVYEFLDRYLLKRWITPGIEKEERITREGIPEINLRFVPQFRFREVGYAGIWRQEEGWDAWRNALHLPAAFVPPAPRQHAEDERPAAANGEETAQAIADSIIQATPDTPQPEGFRVPLWRTRQGDMVTGWRLNTSDSELAAALALAEEIAALLREKDAETHHRILLHLPGSCPQPQPDTTVSPEVIIVLSNAACDFSRALLNEDTPENAAFMKALRAWRQAGAQVIVRDHVCSVRNPIAPFPNLGMLQKNLYAYTQHDVVGVYTESWSNPGFKLTENDRLRAFLVARLLWNPDQVVEDLEREFYQAYYGPAAEQAHAFNAAIAASLAASRKPLRADAPPAWLTVDGVEQANTALADALKSLEQSVYRNRIADLVSTLEYAQAVCPPEIITAEDGTQTERRPGSRPLSQVLERLQGRNIATGVENLDLIEIVQQDYDALNAAPSP